MELPAQALYFGAAVLAVLQAGIHIGLFIFDAPSNLDAGFSLYKVATVLLCMMMPFGRTAAASILISLTFSTINVASELEPLIPVTLSHQGPVYWALPIYIAEEMGFFVYQGLDVSYEVYPSGGPQVEAAVEDQAWDIGAGGIVPNIVGGLNEIETIGISNDETETNALVGTAAWPPFPDTNVTITVTPNSTAHFVVSECLVKEGLNSSLLTFDDPASVLEALTPDANGTTASNYGGLWAQDIYLFLENTSGSAVLCSGRDAGVTVPDGIMVRKAFGDENGETVAKVMAAWFRAIEFMKDGANRAQVLSYMETYYAIYNVSISQAAMEKEIDLRPIHALDEQLFLFERERVNSTVDIWYRDFGLFMEKAGAIEANPDPESYITDKYLQLVREDSVLRAFALGQDPDATPSPAASSTVPPTSEAVDARTSYQLVSGILIAMLALLY